MATAKFAALAVMLTASSTAFAQTGAIPGPATTPAPSASSRLGAGETKADTASLQQDLKARLEKAGFTDVRVLPDSFLVRADDKSGNAVMMSITPDSLTAVTAMNAGSQDRAVGQDNAGSPNNGTSTGNMFTNIPSSDHLSSKVIGLDVYDDQKQDIGTIKDMAFDRSGLSAYIVGVGGHLGMGDHYVAVRPSAIHLSYNADAKKWQATMNTSADQLKNAPEYKYPSKS